MMSSFIKNTTPSKSDAQYVKNETKDLVLVKQYDPRKVLLDEYIKKILFNYTKTQLVLARQPVYQRTFAEIVGTPTFSTRVTYMVKDRNPKKIRHLITTYQARQDYWDHIAVMQKERLEARQLCEAIASRKRRKQLSQVVKPRKVTNVDWYRGYEFVKPEPYKEVQPQMDDLKLAPKANSPKQRKQKVPNEKRQKINPIVASCQPPPDVIWTREKRRSFLINALSKTQAGKILLIGYMHQSLNNPGLMHNLVEDVQALVNSLPDEFGEEPVVPQMDDKGAVGLTATAESKSSNTIIDSVQTIDRGISNPTVSGFKHLAVSKEKQTFKTFYDRWIYLQTFKWQSKHARNDKLLTLELPLDIIKGNENSQNAQLFLTNRFFRTDIVLKFNCNSNNFQVGQLIVGVMYGRTNEGLTVYDNVYSALQRNHARIVAGSSNDTEIVIPYHHMNSMLVLKGESNFATVCVYVLNPLLATSNTTNQCNISVFATFKNSEFYGMISRLSNFSLTNDLRDAAIEPQMEEIGSLVHIGAKVLSTIDKDFNRDNPPQPLQPISFMPTGLPSMSYMDHIPDPVNVLRSDPRGQRPGMKVIDEMNPLQIAKIFGYVKTITWDSSSEAGNAAEYNLLTLPVVPILESKTYDTVIKTVSPALQSFVPTPLAFIASMAGKFRGDIKFKFEVVASRFHSGRVIVGSVPLSSSSTISMKDLKYSAYKVYDIQDSTVFEFNAPWQWFNSFANVRRSISVEDQPSVLFMKIINPLINVAQVPSSVYINVYMAAGDNFELALPRPPILDPFYTVPLVPPKSEVLTPYDLEAKLFTTYNRQISGTINVYPLIPYYGSIIGDWVGYTNVQSDCIYGLSTVLSDNVTQYKLLFNKSATVVSEIRFAAFCPDLTTATSHGLVLFDDKEKARKYVRSIQTPGTDQRDWYNIPLPWIADSSWALMKPAGASAWVTADNDHGYPLWMLLEKVTPKPQMDTRDPVPITTLDIPSACSYQGKLVYGEVYPDLKSICRRYNHFGSIVVKTQTLGNPRDLPYAAKIRVTPMRQLNQGTSKSFDNRYRHGVITTVGSMFRGYIGGMRYWFTVVGAPPEGTTLYVQHRFDHDMSNDQKDVTLGPSSVLTAEDMMNTQYATAVQALSVNSCLTVEVPNYKEQEFLSTLPNSPHRDKSNGSLFMWLHSKTSAEVHFEIYFSVADDFRYTVFQGVPASFDLTLLAPEPQMDTEPVYRPTTMKIQDLIEKEKEETKDDVPSVSGQSLRSRVSKFFSTPQVVAEASVKVSKSVEEASKSLTETSNKLTSFMDDLKDFGSRQKQKLACGVGTAVGSSVMDMMLGLKDRVFRIVSHLVYMVISPTVKTVMWGMVNLYHALFGFTLDGFEKLSTIIQRIWDRMRWPTQQTQAGVVGPQMDDESSDIGGYASLLFVAISTLCCIKVDPPKSWEGIGKTLFKSSQNVRGGYFLKHFINDNFELLKRVIRKFTGLFSVRNNNFKLIAGLEDDRVKRWLIETQVVLNPQHEDQIYGDKIWAQKVFELAIVGRALEIAGLEVSNHCSKVLHIIKDNLKALKGLEKKLMDMNIYSGVRYEPWCLWINGSGGRGKTRYLQHFAELAAVECNYTGPVAYCSLTAGQKYFDSWIGQPTIMLDDFCTMSPTVEIESYYLFLHMKSSSIFNPPFAVAEEKNKLVNFQNLFVSANRLSFDGLTGLHEYEPYNRRRDTMLTFDFRDESMTPEKAKKLPQEAFENLNHLKITIHRNVCSPDKDMEPLVPKPGQTVREALDEFLIGEMRRYHHREITDYKKRCQKIVQRMETLSPKTLQFDDIVAEYSAIIHEDGDKNLLSQWLVKTEKAATYNPDLSPDIEMQPIVTKPSSSAKASGQMDTEGKSSSANVADNLFPTWPQTIPDDDDGLIFNREFEVGKTIHPLTRHDLPYNGPECLHSSFDFEQAIYDKEYEIYYSTRVCDRTEKTSYSVSHCPCRRLNDKGEFETVPSCMMSTSILRRRFFYNLIYRSADESVIHQSKVSAQTKMFGYFQENFHPDVVEFVRNVVLSPFSKAAPIRIAPNSLRALKIAQNSITGQFEVVADEIVHKESQKKSIPQKIWTGLKAVLIALYSASRLIISIGAIIASIGLISSVMSPGSLESQIHPSGDYKTLKSAKSIRTRSLKLIEGNNSATIETDPVQACNVQRQNQGLINKLVKNTFFLVGTVPLGSEDRVISYNARCVGLYNKKFLVLKHYIEHFKSVGVTKVHVVYHNAVGSIAYSLDELEFKWTSQGYGVGELPKSAPRQFANILKYIPSDKFSGEYPSEVIILEVFNDQVMEHSETITRLSKPMIVPQSSTQSAWTIDQGFKYSWGGKGRCGSLIIAPKMACPLIGIHTAGIGEKVGFGEILLSETFAESEDEAIIEFVTPNMDSSPSVYGLNGSYEEIGQLEPSVVPKMSLKTRILPSTIQGVFPVSTEPAPLDNKDPRLEEKGDILRVGVSKRCDPMKEFPKLTVQTAYLDYVNFIRFNVKPCRAHVGPLTVSEAVEGFPITGYDSITMSTSEGYPWVNMRPSGASDKSWLFSLSSYDNGRLKLEGIWEKLSSTLHMKEEMRRRGIVPATYFTACLKDARIAKEKVPILGKTRVFEMSPIELTIAQRQYFLDWTVAYQTARLKAENSIGINCDGEEWTQLANWLLDWSPHILTADFSGYGPRISHTILEKAFDSTTAWLDYFEEFSEQEKEEFFLIREVLKHEVAHGLHIAKDLVFRPTSGLPSGNVETVEKNSQCNSLYWRIAYLELSKIHAPRYADLYFYYKFVRLVHNGDDVIVSVKPEIISWFNNETLIEFFGKFGLKMTDALKQGVIRQYCTLEEATYLKRGFLKHPTREGQWLAPLEKASIMDTANWIWRSLDDKQASLVNSEMSCRLAYTQGPEYYNYIASTIKTAWEKLGVRFMYPSWQALDMHVWENTEGPTFCF